MSLQVEGRSRGRSKSPGGRERERSRSRAGPPLVVDTKPSSSSSYSDRRSGRDDATSVLRSPTSPLSGYDDRRSSSRAQPPLSPSPKLDSYSRGNGRREAEESPRAADDGATRTSTKYSVTSTSGGGSRREKEYRYEETKSSSRRDNEREREREREKERNGGRDRDRDRDRDARERDRVRDRERERDRDREHPSDHGVKHLMDAYLPQKYAQKLEESNVTGFVDRQKDRHEARCDARENELAYGDITAQPASPYERNGRERDYGRDADERDDRRSSKYAPEGLGVKRHDSSARAPSPGPGYDRQREDRPKTYRVDSLGVDPRGSSNGVVTVEPGTTPRKSAMKRSSSPQPPLQRMSSLTVGGLRVGGESQRRMSVSAAPASPLLESYHGTYQSMSPMPSPLLLPTHSHGNQPEIMNISPVGSDDERNGGRNRRARFYDPDAAAKTLADALRGHGPPNLDALIETLPGLTHDQVMELRADYKRLVKTGEERKGVNVAKHIRARLKDADPNLMKACYATALGRWESEAYWSSFWYQGDKTRRELLIESLMGRTNEEVRAIKDGFNDKKYDNSLTKCMKQELKEDKFKKAVLMVLEEKRMEDFDSRGKPIRIDEELVEEDVKALHKAVKAEKGGESAMIAIVVMRSDEHLRAVMMAYQTEYRSNFARDALKKSGNLVGEMLAHILNGAINKPVRDALLIHHALTASRKDGLRRELLISRLVRYHWDRHHMAAVKVAYRERYGKDMQTSVKDMTMNQWGQFCQELCIGRMPDDVKRVDRVDVLKKRYDDHGDER